MQNRYAADVGDFGKFGLLRALAGVTGPGGGPRLSVGVVWYRPSVETGPPGDGTKRGYLDNSRRQPYEACDPGLFAQLKAISDINRNLNEIRDRGVLGDSADFCNCAVEVPERHWSRDRRRDTRAEWWKQALERVAGKQSPLSASIHNIRDMAHRRGTRDDSTRSRGRGCREPCTSGDPRPGKLSSQRRCRHSLTPTTAMQIGADPVSLTP